MQGIIFDLDETLLDRTAAVNDFTHELWTHFFSDGPTTEESLIARVARHDQNGYATREDFFQSLCSDFEESIASREVVEDMFYGHVWENPVLADGVIDCLSLLTQRDVPMGIVTNGSSRAQSNKIKHSGLNEFFGVVVVSEIFGCKKPDPSIYLEASSQLGIDPKKSWFVGDHPTNDIWGSKQVSFNTAWVHLNRPWPADLAPCYDVKGVTFNETMSLLMATRTCS